MADTQYVVYGNEYHVWGQSKQHFRVIAFLRWLDSGAYPHDE